MPLATVGGRKLYYELHGDAPGPPLLLVSGMAGTCRGWRALQVPEFARTRRVLIFDHRGVGESEDPGGAFSTAELADDAVALLDALELPRADVLGGFLGGMVAQEIALRHPHRLGRLILVGTYARPDARRRLLLEKWRAMAAVDTPPEIFLRERLVWTLQDETLEQTDLVEAMSRAFPGHGPRISGELFARQCDAALRHDCAGRLSGIQAATLVVCGRNDQLTPPKFHRELADGIPDARLVSFANGAHLVIAECAEAFNRSVLQFLGD